MKLIFIFTFVTSLMLGQCSTDVNTTEPNGVDTDTTSVVTPQVQESTMDGSTDSTTVKLVETPAN